MLFYLFPAVTSFLLGILRIKGTKQYFLMLVLFISFMSLFVFCCGYMTGSDWRNYELLYAQASFNQLFEYESEKGFYVLVLLFKFIGFTFFPFLIICKCIVFFVIIFFFYIQERRLYFLSFGIFLSTYALFVFVDNPLRFMIALGIITYSFDFLFHRKIISYFGVIILASFFHVSSLVMIPLYFATKIKMRRRYLLLGYFATFFLVTPSLVIQIIERYLPFLIPLIRMYYERMGLLDFSYFTIGRVVYLLFFILILYKRDVIVHHSKNGYALYSLSIIFYYLGLVGNVIPTCFRLAIFLSPIFILTLAFIIDNVFKEKTLIKSCFVAYFLLSMFSKINSTYVYIPYTNYFNYMFDDLPYSYRSNYNERKFYERTGSHPISEWDDKTE